MNTTLENIPFIGKWKAYTGSAMLILGGLHGFLDGALKAVTLSEQLLSAQIGVGAYLNGMGTAISAMSMFALGLVAIGLRHGQEKAAVKASQVVIEGHESVNVEQSAQL